MNGVPGTLPRVSRCDVRLSLGGPGRARDSRSLASGLESGHHSIERAAATRQDISRAVISYLNVTGSRLSLRPPAVSHCGYIRKGREGPAAPGRLRSWP